MYDSLKFHILTSDSIIKYLSDVEERKKRNTGEIYYKGILNNLRIYKNERGVTIHGSLPKFYQGNNYETLTRKDTKMAIEKLSDKLHLPLEKAQINRIEFGDNFVIKYPIGNYFLCFGDARYYHRSEIADKEALVYENKLRCIEFYNKMSDLKRHKEIIPDYFKGQYVFRYELKLNKRVARQMKVSVVVGKMLYDEKFYRSMLKKWQDEYFSIERNNQMKNINFTDIKNIKELKKYVTIKGLKVLGENQVSKGIEANKSNLGKTQRSRLKKWIKDLSNDQNLIKSNDLILELDQKIKDIAEKNKIIS